jgi:hypothetical protein
VAWPIVAVGALAYAVGASFTHPFTTAADVVTAVPLGAAVVVALRRIRSGSGSPLAPAAIGRRVPAVSGWLMWGAVIAVVGGWELYCLANLPRSRYPTLSSLIDMLDSTRVGKALAFAAWLALGWYLAWR